MEMERQHHDESTSLLTESRGRPGYQAAAGEPNRGHVQRGYWPPQASLIAVGAVAAVTVAAAVVHFSAPGHQPYSPLQATTTNLVNKNTADILQGETSSNTPSPLGNEVNKDGMGSSGGRGADGGVKQSEAEEERPPNVIFILIDDVGMNDMGPTSTDLSVATPFIDSLAENGVRLSRYYTNHLCTPARVSRGLRSFDNTSTYIQQHQQH